MKRKLSTYGKYFFEFYNKLEKDLQEKIDWVFELIKSVDQIPKKYFQHLENSAGLFEIRIEFESNIYRIFCFFDEGNLVICLDSTNKCFSKKDTENTQIGT